VERDGVGEVVLRLLPEHHRGERLSREVDEARVEAELQRALDELPDDFRIAVILSDIEELSYKEIAEAVGCPIGTVMSRLHRGRRMLQKTLIEHARSLGIAEPASSEEPSVADLSSFRKRRQGVA
jgi:RNA polymerase sigma-70 factor (ECF subfamily)